MDGHQGENPLDQPLGKNERNIYVWKGWKRKLKPEKILDVLLNLPSVAGVRAALLQSELGTNLLSNRE